MPATFLCSCDSGVGDGHVLMDSFSASSLSSSSTKSFCPSSTTGTGLSGFTLGCAISPTVETLEEEVLIAASKVVMEFPRFGLKQSVVDCDLRLTFTPQQ